MGRDLKIFALSLMVWGIGDGIFSYFQPLYLQQLGANPILIGVILGVYGAVIAGVPIPAGIIADRFGRRPLIWFCFWTGTIAIWIMALSPNLSFFVGGLLLYGLTFLINSPMFSYATAARGKWSVARTITFMSGSYNLGMFIGPLIGGIIADRFGLQAIFYVSAMIVMIAALIVLLIRSQPVALQSPEDNKIQILANRRYLMLLAALFLAYFAGYLPQPLTPNFLRYERGLSLTTLGILSSLAGLGTALINYCIGRMNARTGFLLAQFSMAVFSLFIWKGTGIAWFAAGYFLLGGFKTVRYLAAAQAQALVQDSSMGLAYGFTEATSAAATVLSPFLAGLLYTFNPNWIYPISFVLILVSVLAGRWLTHPAQFAEAIEGVHANQISPG